MGGYIVVSGGVRYDDPAEGVRANLRCSLQLLAARGQDQVAHFFPPDFGNKAFEVVDDYCHWSSSYTTYWTYTEEQERCITQLTAYLDTLDTLNNPGLREDEALLVDPFWEEARSLAKMALSALGWPVEVPPKEHPL